VTVACHYCGKPAFLVTGDVIYPHRPDLESKRFWNCAPCGAYVGCHPGTIKPLGILAKAELRTLKSRVHAAFDPVWRSRQMSRSAAYQWLADGLGIPPQQCHVGMFTEDRCRAALKFLAEAKVPA
jgi:hypothetical protein